MAKQQRKRRKRKSNDFSRQSNSQQTLKLKSSSDINNSRRSNHPYATRSKTLTNSLSMTCFNTQRKHKKLRRRLSDSSIICLGTYRKIPPFIDLEGTTQCIQQAMYERLDG